MTDFDVSVRPAYRVRTDWTDEETAHEMLKRIADQAGIDRDRLSIEEGLLEVDTGP